MDMIHKLQRFAHGNITTIVALPCMSLSACAFSYKPIHHSQSKEGRKEENKEEKNPPHTHTQHRNTEQQLQEEYNHHVNQTYLLN